MRKKNTVKQPSRLDERVDSISAAAVKLFSSKSYIYTSMEDVAKEAGVSKGCAYYYFKSKTELLYFVLSRFLNIVLKDLVQDLEKIDAPVDKMRYFIFRHVKIYAEHMYSAKALFNEGYNLPRAEMKKIKTMEKKYYAIIFEIISSYFGDRLDKNALTMVTFNLLGMCNWIYSWYNPKGSVDPEHFAQIIFDTFINGASKLTA